MKDRRLQVRWIALLVITVIALYLCWLMVYPFLEVLAWAAVLVIIFYPVHQGIIARTKRLGLSALLSCLLVIVTIVLPLTLITIAVVDQLADVVRNVQSLVHEFLDPNNSRLAPILSWLNQYVNIDSLRSQDFILDRIKGAGGTVAGRALGFVGGILGIIVDIAFIIFTMYYLFKDGDRILNALKNALPLNRTQSTEIFRRTHDVISASVYGTLVIAAIQGALGGFAFWVLGIRSAIVWGVVMTFLSLIPMAGAFLVWAPAAIFLLVTGSWIKAILLTAWGALVIGTIDNFLRPKLVGEKTKLHELFIFFSVLGGLQVFGVLGIVLGPVVLAITLALFDVIKQSAGPDNSSIDEPMVVKEAMLDRAQEGTS
jgi:predicted PurR-regulated permease PerM